MSYKTMFLSRFFKIPIKAFAYFEICFGNKVLNNIYGILCIFLYLLIRLLKDILTSRFFVIMFSQKLP